VASADAAPAEIHVRGVIGSYFNSETYSMSDTEEDVLNELNQIPAGKKINLRINSPGGNTQLALGIYNAFARRSADITTYNDGFACSAASVLFAVGSRRISPPSSVIMIHGASSGMEGNEQDAEKFIDMLRTCNSAMAACYAKAAGGTAQEWLEKMKQETWMTGEQAIQCGMATHSADDIQLDADAADGDPEARALIATFKNIPKNLRSRFVTAKAPAIPPVPTTQPTTKSMKKIIDALAAAGFTVAADANEDTLALIISRDIAPVRAELQRLKDATKARITALIESAVKDKVIAESRKAGLTAFALSGQDGEAEVLAQLAELREAKAAASGRGARPVPRGEGEGETIESLLNAQSDAISGNDPQLLAEINSKLAVKRGRQDLFKPVEYQRHN
jgi:ATP-dependent protease ClpP protease subunit